MEKNKIQKVVRLSLAGIATLGALTLGSRLTSGKEFDSKGENDYQYESLTYKGSLEEENVYSNKQLQLKSICTTDGKMFQISFHKNKSPRTLVVLDTKKNATLLRESFTERGELRERFVYSYRKDGSTFCTHEYKDESTNSFKKKEFEVGGMNDTDQKLGRLAKQQQLRNLRQNQKN